ncbi:initiation-control protein YabA [Salinicoccus roseus]|uniref:initiation-control protein YabA n=1 Tax=Salinicoccus roseus TaxID=45670 RepID=UPI001CA6821D|nr:initiation control protein YabA [Salinicoccus roseus]MBY8910298.1 initiation control protein YabA [Salinicoccus roseus]MCG7332046.1 initiation control protein YabA [Salinicoccus roseus]
MDRERLFTHISKLEADMNHMYEELQTLKELSVRLVEENVSLQMEKETYEQLLAKEESEKAKSFKQNTLNNLYDEGFHVCSIHFGTHRHGEDCLFCQGFLQHRNN